MDSKALVTDARLDTVQQCQSIVCGEGCHVAVGDSGHHISKSRHLMEMCGKQAKAANLCGNVSADDRGVGGHEECAEDELIKC